MSRTQVGQLLADRRRNAAAGWLLVAFLAAVALANLLKADLLWAGFVGAALALAVLPPVAHRNPTVMLPWEVLLMAALPVIGRTLATVQLTGRLATYLSVAALALVVAVELHTFTAVRMSYGFAVTFVVVATMATAGTWALVRWGSDLLLGTTFLLDPALSEAAVHDRVMFDFVYSTLAGVVAGGVFELYFRRRAHLEERLPLEVDELT